MKEAKAMKNNSGLKVLGLLATFGGLGLSLLGSFVSEKQTDAKIEEKVLKALAEREKKGE